MQNKPAAKKDHIPEIQLVRAMAILGVLTVHASANATVDMINSGYYPFYNFINIFMKFGTPTFIFLSSFVLFYNYYSRPIDGKLIAGFYKKRLLYIIVPYTVFSLIYYFGIPWLNDTPRFTAEAFRSFWDDLLVGKAFAHLYFVFISIQFYLLFPILLWLTKKRPALVHWLIPFGFIVQYGFVLINLYSWKFSNKGSWSLSYFSFFFFGAALGVYYPKIKNWIVISRQNATPLRITVWTAIWAAWLASALSYVAIYYYARTFGTIFDPLLYEILWGLQAFFAALVLFQASFILYRKLPGFVTKPLYSIGQYSFGIYLVHLLFLFIYTKYVPTYGITWKAHLYYLGGWLFMLIASWLTVALTARFIPIGWIWFGKLPRPANKERKTFI